MIIFDHKSNSIWTQKRFESAFLPLLVNKSGVKKAAVINVLDWRELSTHIPKESDVGGRTTSPAGNRITDYSSV